MNSRLDYALAERGLTSNRSQAESYIKLGNVTVNGQVITKPAFLVKASDILKVLSTQYVSRAALKLEGAAKAFSLDFRGKIVLDVGSSTGGFTDYALKHGAKKVIAVDVGTEQLHPSLRHNPAIELHEKTDIRDFKTSQPLDIVLIDVSFISVRKILPAVAQLCQPTTQIIAMVKPQFETDGGQKNQGVIKNDRLRRAILTEVEAWVKKLFNLTGKADSLVSGSKGNLERFYLLRPLTH